ncbi:MAG: class I SAM-dependent methyltransferase [Gammaproteobacteria bacterium]|jgi:2-polyprenyl-3-methyl-5-hydroxy-6-metoxy-1,4-benzoquinol methylase
MPVDADIPVNATENGRPRCPVCLATEVSSYRQIFDDRFGHPGKFELVRCAGCGHLMTHPPLIDDDLASLYGTYYPRENITTDQVLAAAEKVKLAFAGLRRWLMGVDNQGQYAGRPGEKMLDIGCGSGLSLLEANALGIEAWGIEADPNSQRFAAELGLRIHQGTLQDKPFEEMSFDLIVLNQVIEHIPEPDRTLEIIHKRLEPNGRVILIFPNVNSLWCRLSGLRWINWHVPYHQHHFTLASFTRMARRCGFRVTRSRTITPNGWTILQILANRHSIARGEVNPMWQVKAPPSTGDKAANKSAFAWKKILRLPVLVLVGIVNRLVDSVGYGDSLLVELRPDTRA